MINETKLSRRGFLKTSAVGSLGVIGVPTILTSCTGAEAKSKKAFEVEIPVLPEKAPDGKPLKAGLIGCGGRGTGAVLDMMNAANGIELVALGDIFPDKVEACRENLGKKGITVVDDKCFIGFDAYKKVIDCGVDLVLLCTPPYFRPEHFAYAVEKDKHCFVEKPCGVDSVGARAMLIAGKKADAKGLCIMTGTVRRSQRDVCATLEQVANGAIGQPVSAHVVRMGGASWEKKRVKGWTDGEYVMRNWVNFCWVSSCMLTQNSVHEVDLMNLFLGDKPPISVSATGGRARRQTGDNFDFISAEYTYENGVRAHVTSRQVNGCGNEHRVTVYGTEGYTDCFNTIYNYDGSIKWQYQYPDGKPGDGWKGLGEGFILEHVRLITAIRTGKPINDTPLHVQSTLMGIMAREAAYTGKIITWQEITSSDQKLGPAEVTLGDMKEPIIEISPLPGDPVV